MVIIGYLRKIKFDLFLKILLSYYLEGISRLETDEKKKSKGMVLCGNIWHEAYSQLKTCMENGVYIVQFQLILGYSNDMSFDEMKN